MNILIPMAGEGSRFYKAGYSLPKPLIQVRRNRDSKSMIERVIQNIGLEGNYIFLVRKSHVDNFEIDKVLKEITKQYKFVQNTEIIVVDKLTQGAACTCLLARNFINNSEELFIANCDQLMDWDRNDFLKMNKEHGVIFVFKSTHPNNSYVKVDSNNFVIEAREKQVISDIATCGIYHWKWGAWFVSCAERVIAQNIRTNGEFYVCPTYNEAILAGGRFPIFWVDAHYPIGTPEELVEYENRFK